MNRWRRTIGVVLALALPGLLIWQAGKQFRQERRNHALIVAIKAQNRIHVLELLADGADANARDTGQAPTMTQLLHSIFGRFAARPSLIDHSYHPCALVLASRRNEDFQATNLGHSRSSLPDEEIILALLDHGANAKVEEVTNEYGFIASPVVFALLNDQHRALRRLLELGASPYTTGKAFVVSDTRAVGEQPLGFVFGGSDRNPAEAAQLLVEHGVDVNAAASDGMTPLTQAAMGDRLEGVVWLLQHGAKPGMKDSDGKTALSYARENVKPRGDPIARKIVALLNQYGARK